MTLTDFLLARIAEDEAVARATLDEGPTSEPNDGHWVRGDHEMDECEVHCPTGCMVIYDEGGHGPAEAEHIARHDPARVLAECEAKRRLVRYHQSCAVVVDEQRRGVTRGASVDYWQGEAAGTEVALRLLATTYADHPDYREEWRP